MAVISVDFGAAGKHDSKGAAGALAEATRTPRPDGSSWAHSQYHHREWEPDNRYWTNERWHNDYNAAIAELRTKGTQKAIRSDAVLLRTIVFQASPDFFYPKLSQEHWTDAMINDPRLNLERGELDRSHVDQFYSAVLSYAQDKWGDKLLSVQLHIDEATPHIHVQIVPITDDGRLCNKELIAGGRAGAKAFVDEIAVKIGKPLGLDRAREMTPEEAMEHEGHKSPDAVVTQLMDEERKLLALLKEKNQLLSDSINELRKPAKIPEPFTRKQPAPEYKTNFLGNETDEETEESIQHRQNAWKQTVADREQWFNDNAKQIRSVVSDNTRLSNELEERDKTVTRLKNEIEQLKSERSMYNRISDLTKEVRSIPLEQILRDNGYVLDESVSNRVHRQYRNCEDRKVCITNGTVFVDNHNPESFNGRGPIDLLMCINHGTRDNAYYTETVSQLADMYGITATRTALETDPSIRDHPAVKEAVKTASESIVSAVPRPTYVLPRHNPKKRAQACLWAIHRGITEQTLDALITSRQIILDERYGNIVVPRIHGGWFERGTSGAENRWKKIMGGKDCGPAVIRGPEATENAPLIVCESVSDALALVQEYPSAEVAIISGNLRPKIPRKSNQIVYLAFDNDAKGKAHFEHYSKIFPDAKPLFPPACNDWSDYVRDKPEIEAKNAKKRANLASKLTAVETDPETAESGTNLRPGM